MRIVLLASADIALPLYPVLEASSHNIVGLVCQPDRPAGRKRKLTPCPMKAEAEKRGIAVCCPEKIGDPEFMERLKSWEPDAFLVFAYGQYIPTRVVDFPRCGSINIHPSLLPHYRGASPIQSALAAGEEITGVSIIRVAREMDAGPILAQQQITVEPFDTSATLAPRLAEAGARLAVCVLDSLAAGNSHEIPQDSSLATHCQKLSKEDGCVDWSLPARVLHNRVRAFDPWPGVWFPWSGCADGPLKIWKTRVEDARPSVSPGTVLDISPEGPLIACGDGALRLLELQPPGKSRMSAADFLRGYPMSAGEGLAGPVVD